MSNPPVIIFAYNRIEALNKCVDTLAACPESEVTDLYIFVDGPRNESEAEKVRDVVRFARSVGSQYQFRSVSVEESAVNKGLACSVIEGVDYVINKYGSAIIVEDDLEVLPNFLGYMSDALSRYEAEKEVFSICGYTNKIRIPADYMYDAYFCTRSSSWGWATWADRWNTVDWTFERWEEWKRERAGFNSWGGSDCFSMLDACRKGENSSWAIRFCFAQYLQKGVSLFPVRSLVTNNGFDGSGSNCRKWSRFRHEMGDSSKTEFKMPDNVTINRSLYRSAMSYHGLMIRAWSKIMYALHK